MPKSKTAAEELSKWLNKRAHNELRIKKWEDFLNKLSPKQRYKPRGRNI